jgi:long-chain acyl-CoA synthetase
MFDGRQRRRVRVVEILTAAQAEPMQRAAAGGLRAAGLVAGDRVALLLPASAGLLAVALGALRTGVIPVVLDPALPPAERVELLADCQPGLIVADEATVAGLLAGVPVELAPAPLGRPMHYTSGTTGRRKGVWSGVLDEADGRALLAEEVDLWGFDAQDRHLVLSPLHHSAPLRFAAATLLAGGMVVLAGRFDPAVVCDALAAHRPTTTFCVPTHLRRLFTAGNLPPLDSFRLVAHAGEPCPPAVKQRAVQAFPAGSGYEFYGATEGQFTVCSTAEWQDRPSSVGRPRPGRTLTVDGDGLIWCAVPPYARFTYWRAPEKTAAAWRGDAFTVGDSGRLDADAYLYLDGRRDDLVITGGVNVYPLEVERVLGDCPGVVEVAAYGVPDEEWGQRLCAAVVGAVNEDRLRAYARAHLPPARRPKMYRLVAELPRTSTGKVRRIDLPGLLD